MNETQSGEGNRREYVVCRACHAQCGLIVEFDLNDKPVKTYGDKNNPAFYGYSCIKGRELANNHALETRLLSSQKRIRDKLQNIDWKTAAAEIGDKVKAITDKYGPDSVALYIGTFGYNNLTAQSFAMAWMQALQSQMVFTSVTIDQPGKAIAAAMHGAWLAGAYRVSEWDGLMLVGTNPLVSMNGGLGMNPARNLHEAKKRGMKLIVIDPRCSESARKADLHLQCKPGSDAQILASIARQIIVDKLYDKDFVTENTEGFDELRQALEPFTPERVGAYAGLPSEQIVQAGQLFGSCKKGSISVGTGPNMAGFGNTTEYLNLVITSLLGHWRRAGEAKYNNGVFIKPFPAIAAATGPSLASGFGKKLRVRGLEQCPAGLPTAALADEILLEGKGQIKALFVLGGNPMLAWPDQIKTFKAMQQLDLLVCLDPIVSKTAQLADYVIAPKLHYEIHGNSALNEFVGNFGGGWGFEDTYGQVCDPILPEPEGSSLVEEYAFFLELAKHSKQELEVKSFALLDPEEAEQEKTRVDSSKDLHPLEAWDITLKGSPVKHSDARSEQAAYRGKVFDPEPITVDATPEDWPHRLQIGAEEMLKDLAEAETKMRETKDTSQDQYPMRMLSRRLQAAHNSNWRDNQALKLKYEFNPAFINPDDLADLNINDGDTVEIISARASITSVAVAADDVRRGCISMAHGWGGNPDEPEDPHNKGGNTGRLCFTDRDFDLYTGIPRMSNIAVKVLPAN